MCSDLIRQQSILSLFIPGKYKHAARFPYLFFHLFKVDGISKIQVARVDVSRLLTRQSPHISERTFDRDSIAGSTAFIAFLSGTGTLR